MSVSIGLWHGSKPCFPRVSGDEAVEKAWGSEYDVFSPRERG